jgi:hypothetical protein
VDQSQSYFTTGGLHFNSHKRVKMLEYLSDYSLLQKGPAHEWSYSMKLTLKHQDYAYELIIILNSFL